MERTPGLGSSLAPPLPCLPGLSRRTVEPLGKSEVRAIWHREGEGGAQGEQPAARGKDRVEGAPLNAAEMSPGDKS